MLLKEYIPDNYTILAQTLQEKYQTSSVMAGVLLFVSLLMNIY